MKTKPAPPMTVASLLATPDRWCQGEYERDGAVCLSRAIADCYRSDADERHVRAKVIDRIGQEIIKWNDDPKRTHAQVLALAKELGI